MILGMSIGVFTILHVIITLVAIGSGLIVVGGMFASHRLPVTTALFLFTTAVTSVTGFIFPIHGFTPALGVGILACVILLIAWWPESLVSDETRQRAALRFLAHWMERISCDAFATTNSPVDAEPRRLFGVRRTHVDGKLASRGRWGGEPVGTSRCGWRAVAPRTTGRCLLWIEKRPLSCLNARGAWRCA
jgi:hypothetical protein